ncbi:MAG: CDP-diacylglycerol--serine O-phosphatidyltransferase [Planctomycetota bacterium]
MAPRTHKRKRSVRRALSRVPFLPSLITLGNAFCGFLAIVKITDAALLVSRTGEFGPDALHLVEVAGLLLFLAMVFDGLDGKVARLTDQATQFGAELDSLADAITFGVAPAVIAKFMVDMHAGPGQILPQHPKLYYLCAALYALCAVMRLARFNVETPGLDARSHSMFVGLPSPAAAAMLTSLVVFVCSRQDQPGGGILLAAFGDGIYDWVIYSLPWVTFGCGILMVSQLPYFHVLESLLRGRKSFPFLAVAVFVSFLAVLAWQEVLISLCALYILSGPVLGVYQFLTGRPKLTEFEDDIEDGDEELDDEDPEHRNIYRGPGASSMDA